MRDVEGRLENKRKLLTGVCASVPVSSDWSLWAQLSSPACREKQKEHIKYAQQSKNLGLWTLVTSSVSNLPKIKKPKTLQKHVFSYILWPNSLHNPLSRQMDIDFFFFCHNNQLRNRILCIQGLLLAFWCNLTSFLVILKISVHPAGPFHSFDSRDVPFKLQTYLISPETLSTFPLTRWWGEN